MNKQSASTSVSNATQQKDGINAAIDLFHRRWTMRILWELRETPVTFRALQTACSELSSSVLNVRLAELREAQLVVHLGGEGYALTDWGRELLVAMGPLLKWAARWHRATRTR
jgi:DNA-binding HxlR family transcriptional regulator